MKCGSLLGNVKSLKIHELAYLIQNFSLLRLSGILKCLVEVEALDLILKSSILEASICTEHRQELRTVSRLAQVLDTIVRRADWLLILILVS